MKQISNLTANDLAAAYQLECLSHAYPWSQRLFVSNQGEHYFNVKLHEDNLLLGFAINHIVLDEATLLNLAIHPMYQGQGNGHLLLKHIINVLKQRKISTLWLEVRRSNTVAIALYERLGFNTVTVRKAYYPSKKGREDAFVMAYTF